MEAAQIEVRVEKGKVLVQAIGRTPKGQRFIKAQEVLTVSSIADKNFKGEMTAAVDKILGRGEPTP